MKIAEAVRRMGLADTYQDPHWSKAVKVTDNAVAFSTGPTVTDVRQVTVADVLRALFSGAASGGAYGPGMHGAHGRRASWESLAALAGVQETDITAIEEAAGRCGWLFYTSDWHMRVIPPLDVGVTALRPDRRTVAVLSVTDAD
ncbi:hypothetical protein E1293_31125 [Actinomadura darangshiensis]|uniref:Uncharacterized protein n=1 Tax=Actinomadura darangshiensis TaxID=705336 RepID=A0A4R5AR27_9ACTN|nr:DUF6183 family protein [Actinomadura darangshiensis]TDD73514.1 hypothetical protein E1293_31125 [Actinomadura darangshiensis]